MDFGGGPLTSAGGIDIFLAKFDPAGNHLWSKRFGDGFSQIGYSVTVDGADNVLFTGAFSGSVDFGGGPLTSAGGIDIFLAKFAGSPPVGGIAELPDVAHSPQQTNSRLFHHRIQPWLLTAVLVGIVAVAVYAASQRRRPGKG